MHGDAVEPLTSLIDSLSFVGIEFAMPGFLTRLAATALWLRRKEHAAQNSSIFAVSWAIYGRHRRSIDIHVSVPSHTSCVGAFQEQLAILSSCRIRLSIHGRDRKCRPIEPISYKSSHTTVRNSQRTCTRCRQQSDDVRTVLAGHAVVACEGKAIIAFLALDTDASIALC